MPAIVMGALLTGALFYVAAAGDAIMFRTELQNAADITSFKSAVWHARGMNLIATLNILMSMVLAIFALVRIVEVVCFLLGLIPLLAPVLMPVVQWLVNFEPTLHKFINVALQALEAGEDGISAAVPYVAFADAKATPTSANTIWPLSVSLVPPKAEQLLGTSTRRPDYLPAALPIQDGTFGILCAKATTFIPKQLVSTIDRMGVPGGGQIKSFADVVLDDLGGKVIGAGDGIFCQPINGMISSLISFAADKTCDAVQKKDEEAESAQAEKEQAEQQASSGKDTAVSTEKPDPKKPKTRSKKSGGGAQKALDCEESAAAVTDSVSKALTFSATPAFAWDLASNGNVAMHVWSWAQGEPRLFSATQRGVAIADRGRLPSVTPSGSAEAMAEYYFDCSESWQEHCKPDALWAPNWTARLRRFRSPGEEMQRIGLETVTEFLDTLQQSLGDHANEIVGEAIHKFTGISADNAIATWVGQQVERIPFVHEISEKIDGVVGNARDASGIDELLDPARYTNHDRIH